jgi:hypothetical protein
MVIASKWFSGGLTMNLSPVGGTTPTVTPVRKTSATKEGAPAPPPEGKGINTALHDNYKTISNTSQRRPAINDIVANHT